METVSSSEKVVRYFDGKEIHKRKASLLSVQTTCLQRKFTSNEMIAKVAMPVIFAGDTPDRPRSRIRPN